MTRSAIFELVMSRQVCKKDVYIAERSLLNVIYAGFNRIAPEISSTNNR